MRLILLFSFLLSLKSFSQIDVTFKVDMQYQLVSENGIHIAGTMQGWNPSSTPLTDANGDDIWEVTLTLAENTIYEYKFINGNSWGSDEAVFGNCSAGNGNRQISTTIENMSLPAYVFNSCDFTAYGCTDENATNYDPLANTNDGSCIYPQLEGCTDVLACNYNSNATLEDSTCTYAQLGYDCDSNCVAINIDWIGDQDSDGFTSIDSSANLAYVSIESYPNVGTASISINGEIQPMNYSDWGENAHWYISLELTANNSYSWFVEVSNLCAISQSYSDVFTTDCQNTLNGTSEDLGCGCGEPAQQVGYDCLGNCLIDSDLDGICDEFEIDGCTDNLATNFDPLATDDDGSCIYPQIEGCTDIQACNYNPLANLDDNSCIYIDLGLSSDTSICYSSTLEIIIDDIYSSYLWNNGETSNSIVVDQAGTYFVTITSESGCQVSDSINVSFIPIPYIDVGSILNLCSNDTINLVFFDNWFSTLLLDFENGDTLSENSQIKIDSPGQYQIFVTDSLGCTGFDIFEVVEDLNPIANFEYSFSDNILSTTNLSSNANYFEWQILHHEKVIQDTTENVSVEIELCNNDTILLLAYNNCGVDSMISVFNLTKLDNTEQDFSIFPNPFSDVVILHGYEDFEKYYIKDINGKLIKSGNPSRVLNFEELEKGIYNLILLDDNKYFTQKLLKF